MYLKSQVQKLRNKLSAVLPKIFPIAIPGLGMTLRKTTQSKIIDDLILSVVSGVSWIEAEEKLKSRYAIYPELVDNRYGLIVEFFFQRAQIKLIPGISLIQFCFVDKTIAKAFLGFLKDYLPIQEEVYPSLDACIITLTSEQFHFCRLYYHGNFIDGLKSIIADQYLLKSLRSDEFDYSHRFIMGIIPGENGSRRQNLRPYDRRSHTVTHERKVVERTSKTPMYTAEEKRGYSQIQSTTLIDNKMMSSVFGAFKQRTNKLYGLMTHCDDSLMNRLLTRDRGTVVRPFDIDLENQNINVVSEQWQNDTCLHSPNNLEEFKKQNLVLRKQFGGTNEVLARLRYNPYRTVVCICANTLEARLLAYDFAEELLQEFIRYSKANNIKVNLYFKIPIIFYLPGHKINSHTVFFYTESMRLNDIRRANELYNNSFERNEKFACSDFEFLLGLSDVTVNLLLQPNPDTGSLLAIDMINRGYIRMLMRLLRPNNLAESLFAELMNRKLIKKNDPIIAHLFEVYEFDLARKLIQETNSDINLISFREGLYLGYVFSYGTPRQIEELKKYYASLGELLEKNRRVPTQAIRLYLKEYPCEDKRALGMLLLHYVYSMRYMSDAEFLLEMGADLSVVNRRGETAIVDAARYQNWELVLLIAQRKTDLEDNAKFGCALILALAEMRMDVVIRLLEAGAKPPTSFEVEQAVLIRLIVQNINEEKFLPFILVCKSSIYQLEPWFRDCCEKRYYPFLRIFSKLNIDCKYLIIGNRNLLSNIILDEEFTIANKLIKDGEIDKFKLMHNDALLVDHIIAQGKASHFEYMGREQMLIYMAKNKRWEKLQHWLSAVEVTHGVNEELFSNIVHELLKQYWSWDDSDWGALRQFVGKFLSHFTPTILRKILVIALEKGHYLFAHYLVLNGADWSMGGCSEFPLLPAAEKWQWEIVEELIDEKLVDNAGDAYSAVLMIALSAQKGEIARTLLDRGVKPIWEYQDQSYPLPTERFYQLIDQLGSLSHKKAGILCFQTFYQSVSDMLVTLPCVSAEMLLNEVRCFPLEFIPLAILMIKIGCSSELLQLFLKDKAVAEVVIQSPLMIKFITKNTSFISDCICACAFELSDQLLKLTHTHKMNLKYGNKSLLDHLIEKGNLEQWIYFGLDEIVYKIAQLCDWDKVFELVDRHSVLSEPQCLGRLLHEAAKQGESAFVDLFLKKGADTAVLIECVPVMCYLATAQQWDLINLFSEYDSDAQDNAQYGYAAVIAFRHKQIDLALRLLSRGGLPVHLKNFESALFYAVKYELVDWVPRLIKSEQGSVENPNWVCSGGGIYMMPWRCVLDTPGYNNILFARDLAESKNNEQITSFFEPFSTLYYTPPRERDIHNYYMERVHTTQLFLEAAAYEDAQFATHRLLKYAKRYQLIPGDENNVLKVFETIGSCCFWGIKVYPANLRKVIYKTFRAVLEMATENNIDQSQQVGVRFFAREMSDKEFVARIVSRLEKGETNSYAEYLLKLNSATNCHLEEAVDDHQVLSSQIVV